MNILWVPELYPPVKGGVANSANRIVHNLRSAGMTVDVLTSSSECGNDQNDLTPPFNEVDGGIELFLKPQNKIPYTLQIMYHNIRRMHRLRKYSIIHGFYSGHAGYIATYAAKMLNIASVVSFRGNDVDQVIFDYSTKPFLNDTLNWANAVTYLSEEMLQSLKILKPDGNYFYTPNSIDHEKYKCGDAEIIKAREMKKEYCPNGEKLLGIVGEFKFKKGLRFLLQTLPEIQKIGKTKLLVVGAVGHVDKALLDNPLVIYQPYINSCDITPMYNAMDFLVIPSLFEGMPNVMLESMFTGTINIASDVAAMRDIIENGVNGFKFFPHDKEDFLRAISKAYSLSQQELYMYRERAKKQASEYTLNRETMNYTEIYKKLVCKSK